jgi:hypothetical protein
MEAGIDDSAIIGRVTEAHQLIEKIKSEVFAGEEKRMMRRVVHTSLFYFLVALMVGCIAGMSYSNWQTDNRLSKAKTTGILTMGDGSMFELAPIAPKDQIRVISAGAPSSIGPSVHAGK